jgi:hypothetical protein
MITRRISLFFSEGKLIFEELIKAPQAGTSVSMGWVCAGKRFYSGGARRSCNGRYGFKGRQTESGDNDAGGTVIPC